MNTSTLLAIDCGTQSLRALLFSPTGEMLARVQIVYEPYVSLRPGWAEQDPELFWTSLCQACRQLQQEVPKHFAAVAGVGVTSQRSSMINVDKDGRPLRPAIIWLDQRKTSPPFASRKFLRLLLKLIRREKTVLSLQSEGKGNWIQQQQPEIWAATAKYLQISGFLNYRLTGKFLDSVASQIGHVPFHYRKQRWCRKHEIPALLFPMEPEKLPDLVPPAAGLGGVCAEAARATGLTEGTPVIACGSDKGCETIGAGVIDASMVSLSFGTTATVQTTSADYFEPLRLLPPYPAPIPGFYNPEVEILRGYWMINWFKRQFGYEEVREAEEKGLAAEEILDRHLVNTPPGSMGLVVQPYWSPGLNHPAAKGAMIGFGDVHTKSHIYRAVIEGLAFALRDGLHKIEKRGRLRVTRAAVSGGASQSEAICRITADIFNLPMTKGRTHETSGLGAALVTAVGLGMYDSFVQAAAGMIAEETVFEPDPEAVSLYEQLYQRVYQRIYPALEPLYESIREITGYPE